MSVECGRGWLGGEKIEKKRREKQRKKKKRQKRKGGAKIAVAFCRVVKPLATGKCEKGWRKMHRRPLHKKKKEGTEMMKRRAYKEEGGGEEGEEEAG